LNASTSKPFHWSLLDLPYTNHAVAVVLVVVIVNVIAIIIIIIIISKLIDHYFILFTLWKALHNL
jgi:hypothetical protein